MAKTNLVCVEAGAVFQPSGYSPLLRETSAGIQIEIEVEIMKQ